MAAHPVHPAVVHFPLGLLLTSTVADLAHLAGVWNQPRFTAWLIAAGLAAGVPAMVAGLYDLRRLDEALVPRALGHAGTMAAAWLGYAMALYLRRGALTATVEAPAASVAVAIVGALVLGLGGWLGGELVYRYGAGRVAR